MGLLTEFCNQLCDLACGGVGLEVFYFKCLIMGKGTVFVVEPPFTSRVVGNVNSTNL